MQKSNSIINKLSFTRSVPTVIMTIPDWKFELSNFINWKVKKFNNREKPDWAKPVSNIRKNLYS